MDSGAATFDRLDSILAQGGVGLEGPWATGIRSAKASGAMRIDVGGDRLDDIARSKKHPKPAGVGGDAGRPEHEESNQDPQAKASVRGLPA